MSETENKPTLGRKPLGLKRSVEAGEVKQTFSHGRTNKVVVEVKRRKLIAKPGSGDATPTAPPAEPKKPEPAPEAKAAPKPAEEPKETRQEMQSRLLREAEDARLTSLEESNRRELAERNKAFEEEKGRAGEKNRKADAESVTEVQETAPEEAGAADGAAGGDVPAEA